MVFMAEMYDASADHSTFPRASLHGKSNSEKRIALILAGGPGALNDPPDSNGPGGDRCAISALLLTLADAGYLISDFPPDDATLFQWLHASSDAELETVYGKPQEQTFDRHTVPGLQLGNLFISLQSQNPTAREASERWLREAFGADAVVYWRCGVQLQDGQQHAKTVVVLEEATAATGIPHFAYCGHQGQGHGPATEPLLNALDGASGDFDIPAESHSKE